MATGLLPTTWLASPSWRRRRVSRNGSSRCSVEVARRALKALAALPRRDQLRVGAAIDLLAEAPRPPGCVALAGERNTYRVRVGDCRVLYEVIDDRLVFQVVRPGHRRDVYRS